MLIKDEFDCECPNCGKNLVLKLKLLNREVLEGYKISRKVCDNNEDMRRRELEEAKAEKDMELSQEIVKQGQELIAAALDDVRLGAARRRGEKV